MKDYYSNHPDQYKKHKVNVSKNVSDWQKTHPEEHRLNTKKRMHGMLLRVKLETYLLLGNHCVNPYNLDHGDFLSDIRCLQIDHINGKTLEQKNLFKKNTRKFYKQILEEVRNGSKDYQLLCANCNWIKRVVNDE